MTTNVCIPCHSSDRDLAKEIKALRDQQKALQASSARMEEMIKTFTSTGKENVSRHNHIPRQLSVSGASSKAQTCADNFHM